MGIETMLIASLVVGAASTAYTISANQQAKSEADRATALQMAANTKAAEAESERISFNADRLKKSQRASAAKAGLVTNVGTALDVQKETDVLAARDIRSVMETKDVRNQGALSEAKMFKAGKDASSFGAISGLAQTALGSYDTYKKNSNFKIQQDAASKPATGSMSTNKPLFSYYEKP